MAPEFIRQTCDMAGYTPGEQPSAGERIVKLNTNENPYPPSERVMQALAAVSGETLRRYPNPTADRFPRRRRQTSRRHAAITSSPATAATISSPSPRACFVPPGGTLAFPDPTYSLYPGAGQTAKTPSLSRAMGARLVSPDRSPCRQRRKCHLSGQPQRPQRHIRLAAEGRRAWPEISRASCWSMKLTPISPMTIALRWSAIP